jgi:predicted DNA-binding protein YlxM (UPF0122 family)
LKESFATIRPFTLSERDFEWCALWQIVRPSVSLDELASRYGVTRSAVSQGIKRAAIALDLIPRRGERGRPRHH